MSFLTKGGKLIRKGGKLVTTDDPSKCPCCGGDGPCPPGKYCTWIPPDPCSTGKCKPDRVDDNPFLESQCGDAPYDCRSEEACNQWYEQNPNPPCDCWFCEDGEWVNKPSLDCINEGGILGQKPPPEDCKPPPPPPCEDITCTAWEPSQDADGKDCCKRQCCKAELRPDINGDLTCTCIEDQYEEISYDLTLCGGEPPCTGYGEYMWSGTAWELDDNTCRPSESCRPAPPPTQPGTFAGELKRVDCEPRARQEDNPLP